MSAETTTIVLESQGGFQTQTTLTCMEIVKAACRKLKIQPENAKYFSLCVESEEGPCWAHMSQPLRVNPFLRENNVFLKIRYHPRDIPAFTRDTSAALYFQRQLHRQFMTSHIELVDDGNFGASLALACLEFVRKSKAEFVKAGQSPPKTMRQSLFTEMERKIPLTSVIPIPILKQYADSVIRMQMAQLFAAFWPREDHEILYAYIDAVSKQRAYGIHMVNAELPPVRAQGEYGFASIAGHAIVHGLNGLHFRYPDMPDVHISSFGDLHLVSDVTIDIRSIAGQHKIKLEQPVDAMNFGTLLDGYCALESINIDSYSSIAQLDSPDKIKTMTMKNVTRKFPIDAAYGKISRQESEGILRAYGCIEGLYLLKESVSQPGSYALTVCSRGQVEHFLIDLRREDKKYGIKNGIRYSSLQELIAHYYNESDGISAKLKLNVMELDSNCQEEFGFDAAPAPVARSTNPMEVLAKIEVSPTEFEIGEELGHGEFGTVQRGIWRRKKDGQILKVALKILKENTTGPDQTEAFLREACTWAGMSHPNVVTLLGVCRKQPMMLLVAFGAINSFLKSETKETLPIASLVTFCMQIADGMAYLDSIRCVHRDLAARNVLVAARDLAKISDFGLSRSLEERDYYTSERKGKWPLKWYAPECIYYSKFSSKGDVWSFGVTCWEVLTYGKKPYKGLTGHQVVSLIQEGGRLPKPSDETPAELFSLMMDCWNVSPDARPNFVQIKQRIQRILQPGNSSASKTVNREYQLQSQAFYDLEPSQEELAFEAEEDVSKSMAAATLTPSKIPPSPVQIKFEELEMSNQIGEGAFGAVYIGTYRKARGTVERVAIKMMKNAPPGGVAELVKEAEVMAALDHPFLVRLLGICLSRAPMLVTELVAIGPLNVYLMDNKAKVTVKNILKFNLQIASAMKYMESQHFVHRDLAARNVLVANEGLCKVSDFGLSRAVGAGSEYYRSHQKGKWPIKWYAPECLYENKFTHASDVWSFGVVMWEAFSYGAKPWAELKGREVLKLIDQGQRLAPPSGAPSWALSMMTACWNIDPASRPTFTGITDICQKNQ